MQLLEGNPRKLPLNMNEDDVIEAMRLAKEKLEEQRREIAELNRRLTENHERAELIIFAREQAIESLQKELVQVNNEWREKIRHLNARVEDLESALRPFAKEAKTWRQSAKTHRVGICEWGFNPEEAEFTSEDLRYAAAVMPLTNE